MKRQRGVQSLNWRNAGASLLPLLWPWLCVQLPLASGLPAGDVHKLDYALNAIAAPAPFDEPKPLDEVVLEVICSSPPCHCILVTYSAVVQAYLWQKERSPEDVRQHRDTMLLRIREAGDAMRMSGLHDEWYQDCDKETRAVSGEAQGYLLSALLGASGYEDPGSADLLRYGALAPAHACVLAHAPPLLCRAAHVGGA